MSRPAAAPVISVVLPVRNGSALIGRQLEALARQQVSFVWELIVVDNGSTDDTVAKAEEFSDRLPLRIVHHGERGLAGSRNAGVEASAARLIAHCDADDEVAEEWLRSIVRCLECGVG